MSSTSGHFCTLLLVFLFLGGFFDIFPLMLPTLISCNKEFILHDVVFEIIIVLSSKSNFHSGQ